MAEYLCSLYKTSESFPIFAVATHLQTLQACAVMLLVVEKTVGGLSLMLVLTSLLFDKRHFQIHLRVSPSHREDQGFSSLYEADQAPFFACQ
jgi:hypothetical protein